MLGCIALVAGPGARLALLQPMLDPLVVQGGHSRLTSGPELIAAVHQPGPGGLAGPVSSADGRWALCFSGRLDNLAELRAALAASGREPAGPGEPAVVLAAFLAWGEGAVRRLRGDFAVALADQSCGSVYLARDPLGGRPLYWSRWAGCLLVASQVKSLVPAGQPVREVPPGQHGWAEPGAGCDLVPFAGPPGLGPAPGLPPLGDPVLAAELIRDALRDAIAMRATAGPLGVLVAGLGTVGHGTVGHRAGGALAGGGLAGAIIARLACEIRPDCIVLTPGPPDSPDVALGRRLAADLGLRHEAAGLRPGGRRRQRAAAQEAIRICELAGEAEISAAMTMLPLLHRAYDLGVPAVLTGHGAPELFGGSALAWPPQPAAWGSSPHSIPPQATVGAGTGCGTGRDRAGREAAGRLWRLVGAELPGLDRLAAAAGVELRTPILDLSVVCLGLRVPGALRDGDGLPDWVLRQAFGQMLPGYVLAGYRHDEQDQRRRLTGRARAPLSLRQAMRVYRSLGYDLLGSSRLGSTPATPASPVTGPELHCAQARP